MARQERDILERAVKVVSEQAAKADELVDEATEAGLDGSHQVTIHAKMLRLELLQVKADLERNSDSSCSTVQTADGQSIGSLGSARSPDTGRTGNRRPMVSQWSDPRLQDDNVQVIGSLPFESGLEQTN